MTTINKSSLLFLRFSYWHCKLITTLFLILFLQIHFTANASKQSNCCLAPINIAAEVIWTLDATVNGVTFYHSITECNGKNVVFLKLNNTNNYSVKVSWKEVFTTQEGPEIEGYLGTKTLETGPGEIAETNCNNPTHTQLLILNQQVKPTYLANILKFDYKAITVVRMN